MFTVKRGQMRNFKERHGVRPLKVVKPFLLELAENTKKINLEPNQLWNADERAFFWNLVPDRTLMHAKYKTALGRKLSKERVMFLTSANSDGTYKLKLMVIGKSRISRELKNCAIPTEYHSTKNALFFKMSHKSFVKDIARFKKVKYKQQSHFINCKSNTINQWWWQHGNMFLSSMQPMDQSVVRLTKMYYQKRLSVHYTCNNFKK